MIDGIKREKIYGKSVNSKSKKGKYIKSRVSNNPKDIAIDATFRAAALRNGSKLKRNSNNSKKTLGIKREDLREKIRKHGVKLSIALIIDMSGSMDTDEKLNRTKTILQKIISNVNVNKDKLAVIGFKGKDSEVIIPNTKRPGSFLDKLQNITVGGTTPMATGLERGFEILKNDCKKEEYIPMIMILSDGVTNVGLTKSNIYNADNTNFNSNNADLGIVKSHDNKKILKNPIDDVLDIGEKIAKSDIHTVIVNFEKEKNKGRSVNKELAFVTGGKFYDLKELGDILAEDVFKGKSIYNDSLAPDSFKSDLSEMVIENILDFERKNV